MNKSIIQPIKVTHEENNILYSEEGMEPRIIQTYRNIYRSPLRTPLWIPTVKKKGTEQNVTIRAWDHMMRQAAKDIRSNAIANWQRHKE
jgi:hypothetical protein